MREIIKRTYKILALALVFFLLGLIFFFTRGRSELQTPLVIETREQAREVVVGDTQSLKSFMRHMPPAEQFKMLVYKAGNESLTVSGTCTDIYETVLIYPSAIDYRQDPLSAVYNDAETCEEVGVGYERMISLSGRQLHDGESYYVIRAPQGAQGMWYAPY